MRDGIRSRMVCAAAVVVPAMLIVVCSRRRPEGAPDAAVPAAAAAAAPLAPRVADSSLLTSPPSPSPGTLVLEAATDRGVPLHAAPGDRAVSGRVAGGTTVDELDRARGGRWILIRAPDGATGWIVEKYVAAPPRDGGAAGGPHVVPAGLPEGFPEPDATCPTAHPPPDTKLTEVAARDAASVPGETVDAAALDRFVVVSYNLWELYDGLDGDDYLADGSHPESGTLDEAHAARRVEALGAAVAETGAHVFVFQEVESAALACAVAARAMPRAGWTCWSGTWASEPHPQNVAVASRVPGTATVLDPGPGMGLRGVVEFEPAGLPLRIAAVHLKSSVGAVGEADCGNAAKRMAVAYGLWLRQGSIPDAAYLVVGDVNVDAADPAKIGYDRTDDILAMAGAEDLIERFSASVRGDESARRRRSIVDRAYLRPHENVVAEDIRFVETAPLRGWASDHRPLVVMLDLR